MSHFQGDSGWHLLRYTQMELALPQYPSNQTWHWRPCSTKDHKPGAPEEKQRIEEIFKSFVESDWRHGLTKLFQFAGFGWKDWVQVPGSINSQKTCESCWFICACIWSYIIYPWDGTPDDTVREIQQRMVSSALLVLLAWPPPGVKCGSW